jgi:hypothetical protein
MQDHEFNDGHVGFRKWNPLFDFKAWPARADKRPGLSNGKQQCNQAHLLTNFTVLRKSKSLVRMCEHNLNLLLWFSLKEYHLWCAKQFLSPSHYKSNTLAVTLKTVEMLLLSTTCGKPNHESDKQQCRGI